MDGDYDYLQYLRAATPLLNFTLDTIHQSRLILINATPYVTRGPGIWENGSIFTLLKQSGPGPLEFEVVKVVLHRSHG